MPSKNSFLQNISAGISKRLSGTKRDQYKKANLNWVKIKYLKHVPANKIHQHKLLGHETFFKGGSEYLYGLEEIFIEEIYKQKLPEDAFVLDCGAHIGLSVLYVKSICPTARIIAFEPDAENYSLLCRNIHSHELENIEARQEAVWIENTTLQFSQDGNMGSKIENNSKNNTVNVQAKRLKNFITTKVDFLKLDIEGAEYVVLEDIHENLRLVNNMFIEYHGTYAQNDELVKIFILIEKYGFQFYIKEAADNHSQPFLKADSPTDYDVQLNIFCFRN
ncbi:hypothetical protein BH20BAC1_BH20BAC1_19610 [soil metagenome]|jgi:FkbM family methyltransferase